MVRIPVKVFSILFGVVGGWASALYFIDSVGSKPAGATGNWRMWDLASGTSSNPYARAHFLFEGRVPPAQSLFQVYTNSRDDEGNFLLRGRFGVPISERADGLFADFHAIVEIAQHGFEHDADADRQARNFAAEPPPVFNALWYSTVLCGKRVKEIKGKSSPGGNR